MNSIKPKKIDNFQKLSCITAIQINIFRGEILRDNLEIIKGSFEDN